MRTTKGVLRMRLVPREVMAVVVAMVRRQARRQVRRRRQVGKVTLQMCPYR
jgi:hypothetical protein